MTQRDMIDRVANELFNQGFDAAHALLDRFETEHGPSLQSCRIMDRAEDIVAEWDRRYDR